MFTLGFIFLVCLTQQIYILLRILKCWFRGLVIDLFVYKMFSSGVQGTAAVGEQIKVFQLWEKLVYGDECRVGFSSSYGFGRYSFVIWI